MSAQEQLDELLALGRGTPLPHTGLPPVHELVAEFARTDPDRIAVRSDGHEISYGELHAWAGRIAARLVAAGAGRGSHVGVFAPPSTAMVAAALGILQAGAAYVPVDYAQPDQRIAAVLTDARVASAVVTSESTTRLAGLNIPLIQAEDAFDGAESDVSSAVTLGDAAYLIYTSGSTGEPKGVLVEHGHLAASTLARRNVYPGAPVFLLVSPLAFDSSVAGLWGTLTAGGCLIVATSDEVRDPQRLVELVDEHHVTRLLCVPSLYNVMLDAADRVGVERLATLDTVIVAGEPLPEALAKRHFTLPGSVALVNEYGPTEATVWASYQRFDAPGPVSVGGPVPGSRLYVLDDQLRPVPHGVEGELFIGGAGVSRGYFGRPAATTHAFVADPFAGNDGARMYRTGDRVRWNDDGTLDFIGRRDHQVKIRGHRIELGAVEAALRAVPGVSDAVVVPDNDQTRLVGFVLATSPAESIREQLAERLPAAAIPAQIQVLEHFPLTFAGKVNRTLLQAEVDQEPVGPVRPDGAATGVAAAWAEVLKVSDVPPDANFFDLGGHSLTMFQLQDALERHTGTRPSVVALFRHTTVSAQAALISGGQDASVPDRRQAAARRAQAVRARRRRTTQESAK